MRERGHYWARYAISSKPSVVFFDGFTWWEIGCGTPHREDYWHTIGPKIEEPEEV